LIESAAVFRAVAILLAITFVLTGTGLAGHIHEIVDPAHSVTPQGTPAGHDHGPKPAGNDKPHCAVCLTLHAPFTAPLAGSFDVALEQAVERAIFLQEQRLDASVPAPRGCRGPPVV
jgi:hypothetical protein